MYVVAGFSPRPVPVAGICSNSITYAGEFYDIDAFDQPGVEYGKKLTFAIIR
jgi:glucose-6-phosphate isomerase